MSLRTSSSSSSNSAATKTGGILDSLIASLVSSNQDLTLSEAELDKLISDAILQETRDRNAGGTGSRTKSSAGETSAPDPSKAASTNKNFLAGVIRGVEGHNRAVIKRGLREALEGEKRRRRGNTGGYDDQPTRRQSGGDHSNRYPRDLDRRATGSASSSRSISKTEKPQAIPSKMDKYFTSSYDPSLDIAPEHSTKTVEGDGGWGLIEDGGWDTLLDRAKTRDEEERREVEERSKRRKARRQEEDERSRRRADKARDRDRDRGLVSERSRGHTKEASSHQRHRDRPVSPGRSRSPRRDHDFEQRQRHSRRDARSESCSPSRSSTSDRARKSHHRIHNRSRDEEEGHRSRHSRRNRSASRSRSASPERRRRTSHRHRSKADKEEKEATVLGSSALDTKYAPKGSVREWDLGKSR